MNKREHYLCVRPGFLGKTEVTGHSLWSTNTFYRYRQFSRTTVLRTPAEVRRWAKRHNISADEAANAINALND